MTASTAFIELLKDSMRALGPVSVRRMFGGAGVYADGVMFALIAEDTLYFKADDETKHSFAAEGLPPFTYDGGGRTVILPYWRAPERLLDDPDEMTAWARAALNVARRAAASKPRRKRPARSVRKSRDSR